MNKITAPLNAGMKGAAVADLQDALIAMFMSGAIPTDGEAARKRFVAELNKERSQSSFGDGTAKILAFAQLAFGMRGSGAVDVATAAYINRLLGLANPSEDGTTVAGSVSGHVSALDGGEAFGLIIEVIAVSAESKAALGSSVVGKDGDYRVVYSAGRQGSLNLQLRVFTYGGRSLGQSQLVRNAPRELKLDLYIGRDSVLDPQSRFSVRGSVAGEGGPAVGGLRVEIVDRRVGGDVVLTSAMTGISGRYEAAFVLGALLTDARDRPDLMARVYQGTELLGRSALHVDARDGEVIDVVLPAAARSTLESEVESLASELRPHYAGRLADLRENQDDRDITLLARKSGWDARLIAMSAAAGRFSELSGVGGGEVIAPEWFYALFRAGLPANAEALFRTGVVQVESIWKMALESAVIPQRLAASMTAALKRFAELRVGQLLVSAPPVGVSPIGDMLRLSLGDDAGKHRRFVQIHAKQSANPEQFWKSIDAEFGADTADKLRIDGQLSSLTLNNAAVVAALHQASDAKRVTNPRELVASGLYRAASWSKLLDSAELPAEITGDSLEQRRGRYAELMAAQLRLNFPTAVVAQMVRVGESQLRETDGKPASEATRTAVHEFLDKHQDQFALGAQSVEQFIRQNNLTGVKPEVVREVNRLQRVYQITPGDEAMNVLLRDGVDSAYAVVNYDCDRFVTAFKDKLGGDSEAKLVYAKAEQVHGAVLNLAVAYLGAKNAPGIGVHSPAQIINPAPNVPNPNTTDILAYAALEDLFGEMDYCECEHCRSVLSPAAYLVDLLKFLDPPGHAYPAPQRVLLERRPDIQHLPLTCENTNTPLPQIDLVNETLEFYVAADSTVAAPQLALSLSGFKGNDTAPGVRPEELLASPSYVREAAYKLLESASFPVLLPFNQPLESLRRHFARFEAPLGRVMESLRVNENLERLGTAAQPAYGWRDVFMEELRLSRAEYALLTDSARPLRELFGFAAGTGDAQVLTQIAKAKPFSRRINVSYEELVRILGTQFVNPNSVLIPKLLRLGVPFATLKQVKDGTITDAQFLATIAPQLDAAEYGGNIPAWVKGNANYDRIMSLLTLADPTANPADTDLCNFDNLEFRYALPDNVANAARAFEYLRLLRFIRLWRKLGWPIELIDHAITALYPVDQLPNQADDAVNRQRLDDGFRVLLLRLGIVQRVLNDLGIDEKRDLSGLLACFAPIGTRGADSLYRSLFLGTEFLRQHPQFADDGYGNYLDDPNARLLAQREALRGALQLTDDELSLIASTLQYDANTVLNIQAVSSLFRYGWLARKLKLSVVEFIALVAESQIDPFAELKIGAAPGQALPAILRFLRFIEDLRATNLKPVQAIYLLWNRDLSGKSAPVEAAIFSFAAGLRRDLSGVVAEMSVVVDPDGTVARERMALVYGADTTETFFGLLEGTLVTSVPYSHPTSTLAAAVIAIVPGQLAYDDLRKQLSFRGVLGAPLQAQLRAAQSPNFQAAIDSLFAANQRIVAPFFAAFPELRQAFDTYVASVAPLEQRRSQMLDAFLPILIQRRSRQLAVQAMSTEVKSNSDFVSNLIEKQSRGVYLLHAQGDPTRPGLDDLVAVGTPGLAARFFFRSTATGVVDQSSAAESDLSYSAGAHPLPQDLAALAANVSTIWSGYIEAPESGFYNLRIEADMGAAVTLSLADNVVAMANVGNQWSNAAPIELVAGRLVPIELTVENTRSMIARWQTATRPWEVIPPRFLYAKSALAALSGQYVRTFKVASLQSALELSMAEFAHLASDVSTRVNNQSWLNVLPVSAAAVPATGAALYSALRVLMDFSLLKARFSAQEERLLEAVRDPAASLPGGQNRLLALTRWSEASLTHMLARFGMLRTDLSNPNKLRRVADAMLWLDKLGISAAALTASATNQPDATMVRTMQAALRARYSEADWLKVLQPINDELRTLQRDALVAFILQKMSLNPASEHIDTPDRLFEYFLMDVQMEPCMQTSRVRHALSAVQLFIDRCLMNLESRVVSSSINAQQWQWMNRYRVWEANRKVFLYPENWLEPELRDDQSPIFKETMSELLQSDITEDRAATALLGYLGKLEEIAKLEPCGMCHIEGAPGTADDITHVVARTAGASRKYFYRRRENGSWSPWEQIKLDIEDNPVVPVIWKGRLFLFWLRVLRHMPEQQTANEAVPNDAKNLAETKMVEAKNQARKSTGEESKVRFTAILCWSEYFNGSWQGVKTSSVLKPLPLMTAREELFDRSQLTLLANEYEGSLVMTVGNRSFPPAHSLGRFRMYNTHSEPVVSRPYLFEPWNLKPLRFMETYNGHLVANYYGVYAPHSAVFSTEPPLDLHILDSLVGEQRLVEPANMTQNPWSAPFFMSDAPYSFFVTTTKHEPLMNSYLDTNFGHYFTKVGARVVNLPDLVVDTDVVGMTSVKNALQNASLFTYRPPIDADPTRGSFLRRTLAFTDSWRYDDQEIGAAGAVIDTPKR